MTARPPVECRPLLTRAPWSPNRSGTTKAWLILPALMGLALFGLALFKNDEGTSVAASPRRLQEDSQDAYCQLQSFSDDDCSTLTNASQGEFGSE